LDEATQFDPVFAGEVGENVRHLAPAGCTGLLGTGPPASSLMDSRLDGENVRLLLAAKSLEGDAEGFSPFLLGVKILLATDSFDGEKERTLALL